MIPLRTPTRPYSPRSGLPDPSGSGTRARPPRPAAASRVAIGPDSHLPLAPPITPRHHDCRCGRAVFFRDSECPGCQTALGYDPVQGRLLPLLPVLPAEGGNVADAGPALWQPADEPDAAARYHRCSHLDTESACNWLVAAADRHSGTPVLCRCCRLNRTLPDLSQDDSAASWLAIELAKRRLVALLITLGLPLRSKGEDPARGLAFDLLRAEAGGMPVETGYADGVITLDIEEADDAWRRQRRTLAAEPCRTLLGDLRHEVGHYYWQRLVEGGRWLGPCRALFGDERRDHAAALHRHGHDGAPPDWRQRCVSSYASSHPLEDWAETFTHYLQIVDTLDTARGYGLDGERVETDHPRWEPDALAGSGDPRAREFLVLINGWLEVTSMLNGISRSMGLADAHPFVLSRTAVRKLHLVHRIVADATLQRQAQEDPALPAQVQLLQVQQT